MARHKMVSWLAAASVTFAVAASAHGRVWYVKWNATDPPDGNSWPSAFRSLQDALAVPPAAFDEIWVAKGTYYPDEVIYQEYDRGATFTLVVNVGIYGGFSGVGEERDVWANETILSGDLLDNDGDDFQNYDDNSFHVVTFEGDPAFPTLWKTPVLDGFTVTGGNATPVNGPDCAYLERYTSWGGGVLLDAGTIGGPLLFGHLGPRFQNCTFVGNKAADVGGAIGGRNMGVHLRNCTFENNKALSACEPPFVFPSDGGGAVSVTGEMEIVNCRFINNRSAGPGGAVEGPAHAGEYAKLTNCEFRENWADSAGGGVYFDRGSGYIVNCLFAGNESYGIPQPDAPPDTHGGGIYSQGLPIVNCTFVDNRAFDDDGTEALGGGAFVGDGDVANCIFLGNFAENSSTTWWVQQVKGECCPDYSFIEGFNPESDCGAAPDCDPCVYPDCSGMTDAPPTFVDPDGPDNTVGTYDDNVYRLRVCSRCVDEGNPDSGHTVIPCDEFNADDDEDGGPDACADPVTGEPTPDPPDDWLNPPPDGQLRVVDSPDGDSVAVVDMGYDEVVPIDCPWDCQAEPNGQVDVADFLHLLDEWGQECPTADCDQIAPPGAGTEDFLALLVHWGPCTEQASASGGSGSAYDAGEVALELMGFDGLEGYRAWLTQATDDEAFASLVVFAALLVQP